jgi:hypothetical protein
VIGDEARPHDAADVGARRLPPVTEIAVVTLALIVVGGIYLSAQIPGDPPLAPAVGLLFVAAVLLGANIVLLGRLQPFAWRRFLQVYGWTQLAFALTAGMIGLVFVLDGTQGTALVVLLLMLVVYATDIPLLLAFSVARYADSAPDETAEGVNP